MENEKPVNDLVMEELQKLMRLSLPTKLVTNFIIVAEVADEESQDLSLIVSDGATPWLAFGMLNSAMSMLNSGEYQFPLDEEGE